MALDDFQNGVGGLGDQRYHGLFAEQVRCGQVTDMQDVALQLLGVVHQVTDQVGLF